MFRINLSAAGPASEVNQLDRTVTIGGINQASISSSELQYPLVLFSINQFNSTLIAITFDLNQAWSCVAPFETAHSNLKRNKSDWTGVDQILFMRLLSSVGLNHAK